MNEAKNTIDTGGGAATGGNVSTSGGRYTGRDADDRQNTARGGDTYVGAQGSNNDWIRDKIYEHGQLIRDLTYRLDNIPAEFRTMQDQVRKLSDLQVVVTPQRVIIQPTTIDNMTVSTLMRILIGVGVFVLIVLAVSIWVVLTRG